MHICCLCGGEEARLNRGDYGNKVSLCVKTSVVSAKSVIFTDRSDYILCRNENEVLREEMKIGQ